MPVAEMTSLEAALRYRENGLAVFPTWPMRNGVCACRNGCGRDAGKHPLWIRENFEHGLTDATTSEELILEAWTSWPDAGIGYLPQLGLDVDPRDGGDVTLADLVMKHGPLPETWEVQAGGEDHGRHLLFSLPGKMVLPKTLGPGLDVKGCGTGYLIAPPTLHRSDRRYQWRPGFAPWEIELAPAPDWLIEELRKAGAYYPKSGSGSTPKPGDPADVAKARQALTQLDKARADRYADWVKVGMILHSVSDDLGEEWDTWSKQSEKYTEGACGEKWATFDRDRQGAATLGTLISWAREDSPPAPPADPAAPAMPNQLTIAPVDLESYARNGIPPIEWYLDRWLARRDIAIGAGEGGAGKSTTTYDMGAALAYRRPWLGIMPTRAYRVVIIDEQQGEHEAARLLLSLCQPHPNLTLYSMAGLTIDTEQGRTRVLHVIEKHSAEVVIVDSLSEFFALKSEIDNSEITQRFQFLYELRDRLDVTWQLIHHRPKTGGFKVSPIDMFRGGTNFINSASCGWASIPVVTGALDLIQAKRRGADKTKIRSVYHRDNEGHITLTGEPLVDEDDGKLVAAMDEITKFLRGRGESRTKDIHAATKIAQVEERTSKRALSLMVKLDRIARPRHGFYSLSDTKNDEEAE